MNILVILMGISLFLGLLFLGLFLWNLNRGQFADDYTPSLRILFEDQPESMDAPTNHHSNTQPKK